MGDTAAKISAIIVFGLVLLVIVGVYGSFLIPSSSLAVIWLISFGIFIFCKSSPEYRGLFLVAVSLGIAVIARKVFPDETNIDLLADFILLVGGGVGANFITAGLLKEHRK
jgi:hypothetical protein